MEEGIVLVERLHLVVHFVVVVMVGVVSLVEVVWTVLLVVRLVVVVLGGGSDGGGKICVLDRVGHNLIPVSDSPSALCPRRRLGRWQGLAPPPPGTYSLAIK